MPWRKYTLTYSERHPRALREPAAYAEPAAAGGQQRVVADEEGITLGRPAAERGPARVPDQRRP